MASPAAYLDVVVDLQTGTATTELRRLNSNLTKFDRRTVSATTRTSSLGKATSGLGTGLRRAAGYAVGAAAAYLSISQAKTAVTTTQDLAKTTAGLNRNLDIGIKRSSQWAGVAKARDIDAKALNLSFTTLSRNLFEARKGTEANVEQFTRLGVSQKELQGLSFNESVMKVADAFGEAEGGAKRQATAQKLLGRGYQTILPMFADGAKGLREQLEWAEKYGVELDRNTVSKQMDLVNAQRESKEAFMGLQITFTKWLTPALKKANDQFQRIAAIMANDKLTKEEKWRRVGNIIETWADKAMDAFLVMLPKLIEKVGEQAPKIAKAFVEGFLASDVWGRLLAGAWLLSKLGGVAAFQTAGTKGGKVFGKLFVAGMVLALPALIPEAFKLGEKMGRAIKKGIGDIADIFEPEGAKDNISEWEPGKIIRAVKIAGGQIEPRGQWASLPDSDMSMEDATKQLRAVGISAERAAKIVNKAYGFAHDNVKHHAEGMGDANKTLANNQARSTDKIVKGNDRLRQSATDTGRKVVGSVDNMSSATGEGYNRLKDNTNKALSAFDAKTLNFKIDLQKHGNEGSGFARGGNVPGKGNRDTVPAWLTPGEYVVNAKDAARTRSLLEHINAGHYATGGPVTGDIAGLQPNFLSALRAMAGGTGTAITVNSGFRSRAEQAGLYAQFLAGTGNLAAPPGSSHHETGTAADIAPGRSTFGGVASKYGLGFTVPSESWHIELLNAAAAGKFGAAATKVARVLLQGPKGPLKDMGQRGLDKVRGAANKYIAKQQPAMTAGGLGGPIPEGSGRALMQAISQQRGWNFADWWALDAAESSHGMNLSNPSSSARLRGQFLDFNYGKYGPGSDPAQNPSMREQIISMAAYIADRYDNPTKAWAFHQGHNWYGKGGPVEMPSLDTGGRVTSAGMARVHPGDVHMGGGRIELVVKGDAAAFALAQADEIYGMIDGERVEVQGAAKRKARRRRG